MKSGFILSHLLFDPVETSMLRVVIENNKRSNNSLLASAVYAFEVYNTDNIAGNRYGEMDTAVTVTSSNSQPANLQKVGVLVNKKGTQISDLIMELYNAQNHIPTGTPLKTMTIPLEELQFGMETQVDISYEGLVSGQDMQFLCVIRMLSHIKKNSILKF
jgi:hypothetical protein